MFADRSIVNAITKIKSQDRGRGYPIFDSKTEKEREREREQVNQDLYSQESVVEKRFKRNEMKNRNLAVAPGSPPWKRARQKEREREKNRRICF